MQFLNLGASLYVPSIRPDLASIGNLQKLPNLRSVIFCTEDSIRESETTQGLNNLEFTLRELEPLPLLRFIRVRNPGVLRILLQMSDIHKIHGFVLPKITQYNLYEYFSALRPEDPFSVMPTLESVEVFDMGEMTALRNLLLEESYRRRVFSLRIGGNDLLNLLGIRRPRNRIIYSTPLRLLINQLVTLFRPHGFNLSAPVFEYLDRDDVLCKEVRADLAHGLFGKTAIHPTQVPLIESQYKVSRQDLQMAEKILAGSAPAVFRCHNAMCEPATHSVWARLIHERAKIFGIRSTRKGLPAVATEMTNGLNGHA